MIGSEPGLCAAVGPERRVVLPGALLHPVLARVPFLLDSPFQPLEAALQIRPLPAPQERQPVST